MRDKNNGNWNQAVAERGLTWHHVGDGSIMQLVDSKIHNTATNGGGRCSQRW
ncbi:HNH endonuclease [Agrobacterium rosae]|uniref:HNH endonuclease n=1 Tax=Agrobacterium rosae TaxID=1972867 RepID=UPI00097E1632